MRIARKITLLAAVALLAMASAAGSANAAPVEVRSNATGAHCAPTCSIHVTGQNIKLYAHIPFFGELHRYTCNHEYTVAVDEDGNVGVSGFSFTAPSGSTPNPCSELEACNGTSWGGAITHNGAGAETMTVTAAICSPIVTCNGNLALPLNESAFGLSSEVSNARIGTSVCEIEGGTNHWQDEGDPVTLVHV
jgi:hypothetical protein